MCFCNAIVVTQEYKRYEVHNITRPNKTSNSKAVLTHMKYAIVKNPISAGLAIDTRH